MSETVIESGVVEGEMCETRATRNTQHATRNTQHATRNTQHATRTTTCNTFIRAHVARACVCVSVLRASVRMLESEDKWGTNNTI
jgi:hypothetical protein